VHLCIYLVNGTIYYKTDAGQATTITGLTTTGQSCVPGDVNYIWVKLADVDGPHFQIAVTANDSRPSIPGLTDDLDMDNAVTTGWDTILLYTPDANDDGGVVGAATGQEDFESYADGDNIHGKSGPIGDWAVTIVGTATSKVYSDSGNKVMKVVDPGNGHYALSLLTLDDPGNCGNGATDVFTWRQKINATKQGTFCINEGATTRIYLNQYDHPGEFWNHDGSDWGNTGITFSTNTWERFWIKFISTTQFKFGKGDTEPDWGTLSALDNYGHFSGTTNTVTAINFYGNSAETYTLLVDDIRPLWTYVAGDITYTPKTLEAYIYELWSDQTIDLSNVRDTPVNILIDGKHAWRGWVQSEKTTEGPDNEYTLQCLDVTRTMAQQHSLNKYLLATYTVNAYTDDRITIDETPDIAFVGKGALVQLDPAPNHYTTAAGTSLKATSNPDLSAAGAGTYEIESGAIADTQSAESSPVYQTIYLSPHVDFYGQTATCDYTLVRAVGAEIPTRLLIELKGKVKYSANTGFKVSISFYNHTTDQYDKETNLVSGGVTWVYEDQTADIGPPITFLESEAPNYCYSDGGNWNVKCRFNLMIDSSGSEPDLRLMIDCLRCDMEAAAVPFTPIETQIYNIDAANKYLYVNAAPFVDSYLTAGDKIHVGCSMQSVMAQSCVGFDYADIEPSLRYMIQDLKGPTWMDVFRHCATTLGGYWYWTLDEDSGASTMHWIPGILKRVINDSYYYVDLADIADLPNWAIIDAVQSSHQINVPAANGAWTLQVKTLVNILASLVVTYTIPVGSTIAGFEMAIRHVTASTSAAQLSMSFETSGLTERYRIDVDGDKKMTAYGSAGNSGQINHALAGSDFTLIRVVFTSTTATLQVMDAGDMAWETLDNARAITANDIQSFTISMPAAVVNPADFAIGYIRYTMQIDPTSTAIAIQKGAVRQQDAKATRFVYVRGKDDLEKSIDVDATAMRDTVVVDDGLVTQGMVNARAEALAEKLAADSRSIQIKPVDGDTNYQIGDFYEITFNGATITDLPLRRAEFETDGRLTTWSLELDTGETTGRELVAKAGADQRFLNRMSAVNRAT
jgi:hypothetical protein